MLSWANRFNIFCFLDNQDYSIQPHRYDCLLAAGVSDFISSDNPADLDRFLQGRHKWTFGHLSYELKNAVFGFAETKQDPIGFPLLYFFNPQVLLRLSGGKLSVTAKEPNVVFRQIMAQETQGETHHPLKLQQRLSREEYIRIIQQLQQHILRGDCYEINFCQEFYSGNAVINPVAVFERLMRLSPAPFAALYRVNEAYLVCASPERFITKKEGRIYSQPMKGTSKRDLYDAAHDRELIHELRASAKERSENVMVVDMVRNDLSRICVEGSVRVDELFGVYTYPQVHQMISTISGELKRDVRFSEIISAGFPMGSMTGAPKHRVLELIDQYENTARGIFSGSVGYINPDGDFDFNVVIRSIMYNAATKYLSYQVGSGITFYCDAEKEWEECLLKGQAIKKVLTS